MTHRILCCYIGLVCGHFEIWLEGRPPELSSSLPNFNG
jgi:hypothetical protein